MAKRDTGIFQDLSLDRVMVEDEGDIFSYTVEGIRARDIGELERESIELDRFIREYTCLLRAHRSKLSTPKGIFALKETSDLASDVNQIIASLEDILKFVPYTGMLQVSGSNRTGSANTGKAQCNVQPENMTAAVELPLQNNNPDPKLVLLERELEKAVSRREEIYTKYAASLVFHQMAPAYQKYNDELAGLEASNLSYPLREHRKSQLKADLRRSFKEIHDRWYPSMNLTLSTSQEIDRQMRQSVGEKARESTGYDANRTEVEKIISSNEVYHLNLKIPELEGKIKRQSSLPKTHAVPSPSAAYTNKNQQPEEPERYGAVLDKSNLLLENYTRKVAHLARLTYAEMLVYSFIVQHKF